MQKGWGGGGQECMNAGMYSCNEECVLALICMEHGSPDKFQILDTSDFTKINDCLNGLGSADKCSEKKHH